MIERLPWDSQHFRVPVARIPGPDIDDDELWRSVNQARRQGISLLYWFANPKRQISEELLFSLQGRQVGCRSRYHFDTWDRLAALTSAACDKNIIEWQGRNPSRRLLELAVLAGRFSRFNADFRIPRNRFEAMFRIWIQNGLRQDDHHVFVAATDSDWRQPIGFVSTRVGQRDGQISLIAVADAASRLGFGKALLARALATIQRAECNMAWVVTQSNNEPARRLYERCGFQLHSAADVYHFWLGEPVPGRRPSVRSNHSLVASDALALKRDRRVG